MKNALIMLMSLFLVQSALANSPAGRNPEVFKACTEYLPESAERTICIQNQVNPAVTYACAKNLTGVALTICLQNQTQPVIAEGCGLFNGQGTLEIICLQNNVSPEKAKKCAASDNVVKATRCLY